MDECCCACVTKHWVKGSLREIVAVSLNTMRQGFKVDVLLSLNTLCQAGFTAEECCCLTQRWVKGSLQEIVAVSLNTLRQGFKVDECYCH